jgi:hypothetical protein
MTKDIHKAFEDDDDDPLIEECVRVACEPFLSLCTPEELAEHKAFLRAFYLTHPVASRLYRRLKAEPVRSHSTERNVDDAIEDELAKRESGTHGRPL